MKLRAIDMHAHVRTGERVGGGPAYREATKLFGSDHDIADPGTYYRERQMIAVVFDVDTEVSSGERISNDEIGELVDASEGHLIGFCSVDPRKGATAVRELRRCAEAGFRGVKIHPVTGGFHLNNPDFYPVWGACQDLGLPLMVHTGTTGIGAGAPGGRGIKLKYGKVVPDLDDVAADFPDLPIIAAHFGWPWFLEALAVARHKRNVYIDLSGWAPKYLPAEVLQYCNSVIPDKFVFGSDYPLLSPDRWIAEFDQLGLKPEVRSRVLYGNACQLLGIDPDRFVGDGEGDTRGMG